MAAAREALHGLAGVLGLDLGHGATAPGGLSESLVGLLIEVRNEARKAGQYAIADLVRGRLGELGIALEDRPEGTSWRKR